MNKSALSIKLFGFYLEVLGIIFIIIPNLFIGVFGFEPTNQPWIRIMGVLLIILGYFYLQIALNGISKLYSITIHARFFAFIFFIVFVIIGFAKPIIILFGLIDLLTAYWTYRTLK